MPKRAPDNLASDPDLDEKKRARRRLLGAVVLALLAAVLLPLFLDSEPRKPVQEVQVEIQPREPSRVEPQAQPEAGATSSGAAPVAEAPSAKPEAAPDKTDPEPAKAQASEAKAPEISSKTKPAGAVNSATSEVNTKQGSEPAKAAVAAAKPVAAAPKASTDGVSPERPFAVQIGAFASDKGAKEQLARARKTGLKAYTERIETSKGTRIRVRVGPFKTREEAEKARVRLKAAGIDSAIIAP